MWLQAIRAQCKQLEQELRKGKRREEKLTALQYRLKEDVRLMGADSKCVLEASLRLWLDIFACAFSRGLHHFHKTNMLPSTLHIVHTCQASYSERLVAWMRTCDSSHVIVVMPV